MLKKSTCRQCFKECGDKRYLGAFEIDWKQRTVFCPWCLVVGPGEVIKASVAKLKKYAKEGVHKIDSSPPSFCPYSAEHEEEDKKVR